LYPNLNPQGFSSFVRSLSKSDPGIDNNNKIVEPFVLLIYRIKHQVSWSHHPASSSFAEERKDKWLTK
jgi:hypothetical protein